MTNRKHFKMLHSFSFTVRTKGRTLYLCLVPSQEYFPKNVFSLFALLIRSQGDLCLPLRKIENDESVCRKELAPPLLKSVRDPPGHCPAALAKFMVCSVLRGLDGAISVGKMGFPACDTSIKTYLTFFCSVIKHLEERQSFNSLV